MVEVGVKQFFVWNLVWNDCNQMKQWYNKPPICGLLKSHAFRVKLGMVYSRSKEHHHHRWCILDQEHPWFRCFWILEVWMNNYHQLWYFFLKQSVSSLSYTGQMDPGGVLVCSLARIDVNTGKTLLVHLGASVRHSTIYIYIYIFNSHFTYTVTNISYYAVVHILKNGLSPNEAHFSIDAIFSPACPRRREERESLQRMASQSRSSEQSAREDHAMTTWRHDVTTWRFLFTKNWLLSEIFISHMNLYDNIWVEIQDLIVTLNRVWDTRKFG